MARAKGRIPDFFIAGGIRCGAASLFELLKYRPEIFTRSPSNSIAVQLEMLTKEKLLTLYGTEFSRADPNQMCGDICLNALSHSDYVKVLHKINPLAKIIVVIREPIQRLWSHYLINVARGVETHPFEVAIHLEAERSADISPENPYHYLASGHYSRGLAEIERLFGPDQMLVLDFSDVIHKPRSVIDTMYKFIEFGRTHNLGIDSLPASDSAISLYRENMPAKNPLMYHLAKRFIEPDDPQPNPDIETYRSQRQGLPYTIFSLCHPLPEINDKSLQWLDEHYEDYKSLHNKWALKLNGKTSREN